MISSLKTRRQWRQWGDTVKEGCGEHSIVFYYHGGTVTEHCRALACLSSYNLYRHRSGVLIGHNLHHRARVVWVCVCWQWQCIIILQTLQALCLPQAKPVNGPVGLSPVAHIKDLREILSVERVVHVSGSMAKPFGSRLRASLYWAWCHAPKCHAAACERFYEASGSHGLLNAVEYALTRSIAAQSQSVDWKCPHFYCCFVFLCSP